MSIDTLRRLGLFTVFLLAQVLVLGRIHLFQCATPLLYVYFTVSFPRGTAKWSILLWNFFLGLLIDIFSNTPGMAAASLTAIAAIQPYYLELFVPRDSSDDLQPALSTIGPMKYSYYVIPLVVLYCLFFYTLEMFSFANLLFWAVCVVSSSLLTLILIFAFEIARRHRS